MKTIRVFLDSDVVISSLLSSKGASYALIQLKNRVTRFISSYSLRETELVLDRMGISSEKLTPMKKQVSIVSVSKSNENIKKEYSLFVLDENDSHIVAGAVEAKAHYLVTYNAKHFKREDIRKEFSIQVISPGLFLQYLRSIR